MSVHQLIAYTTLALSLRITRSGMPTNLANLFTSTGHSRTRTKLLAPPRHKLNLSLESFPNQSVRLYNEMPDHLKIDAPFNQLKRQLIKWVLDHIRPKA